MNFAISLVIKTSLVLASAGFVALSMRRASASIRHAVWTMGMVVALILPFAAAVLPGRTIHIPAFRNPQLDSILQDQFTREDGIRAEDGGMSTSSLFWQKSPEEAASASAALAICLSIWSVGCLLVFGRFAFSMKAVRRLIAESTVEGMERVSGIADALQRELSITRKVRLAYSSRRIPPMTCGIFRQTVILPSNFVAWPEPRQRAVLAHEFAHVKRNDGMMQCLTQAICSFHWFNPIVWYAAHRTRIEREHACDDLVLRLTPNAEDYATHLLDVARSLSPGSKFSAAAVSILQRSQLERRLVSILDPCVNRDSLSRGIAITLACACVFIASELGMVQPAVTAPLTFSAQVVASNLAAGLTRPKLITATVQPPYTVEAFENSTEGTVTLEAVVDAEGNARAVRVVHGLGYGLDESAVAEVSSWKFSPALKGGSPVEAAMSLDVEFKLAKAAIRLTPRITAPVVVSRVEPESPEEARAVRAKGTVVLDAVVGLDGTVQVARVIQPLGYGLTANAIHALSQWTFNPGSQNGVRLPVSMNISMVFD